MTKRLSINDPNSFSNPEECVLKNINLNLTIDFDKNILKGFVDLEVYRINLQANLILDSKGLVIHSVKAEDTSDDLPFTLHDELKYFGSKLEVQLPKNNNLKFNIRIHYETSPDASGIQWLKSQQTVGKKHPYMFTACQAIHARSVLPCQDTPYVKTPYQATISAPQELVVLMSAILDLKETDDQLKLNKYKFTQKIPIPSYLIAIVCGALKSRTVGPRSKIWSEVEVLDKAAEEFCDTDKMLQCAENFVGEYVWGVYDILVMPPSFPFGGMENPCLTFVSPTTVIGDKSAVSVIIHEITHSWTGNLVTNKNFEHFWLNEGFTTFIENKIIGLMYGDLHRHFAALTNYVFLERAIEQFGEKNELTKLVVDLTGEDPDKGFSHVPYQKGHAFLFYLETVLGGPDVFDEFLRSYIKEFKFQSIDSDTWKNFLFKYFKDKEDILNQVDWDSWLYGPGMPPETPNYCDDLVKVVKNLVESWVEADDDNLERFTPGDVESYTSLQLEQFCAMLHKKEISLKKLQKIDELYKIGSKLHYGIRFEWIRLCLKACWKDIIPNAISFITEQNRLLYIKDIYRGLYNWEETRELAISTYHKHKSEMMSITANVISGILNLQ